MSAFRVSRNHIDVLVQAAIERGLTYDRRPVTAANADEIGADLWRENYASVNHRYNRDTPTPDYRFVGEARVRPESLYKQAACYEYQTCEHPEYRGSAAERLMRDIRAAVLAEAKITKTAMTGGIGRDRQWRLGCPAYESAPWGID